MTISQSNMVSTRPFLTLISFLIFFTLIQLQTTFAEESKDRQRALQQINKFKLPAGMKAELFADRSLTTNPTSFTFDSKGRLFICEIHRYQEGSFGIHRRMEMIKEDIANQNNEDRLKMYEKYKHIYPMSTYTSKSDMIRIIEDTNDDGIADKSTLFADDFDDILDGPGIGIIERDGKFYYTNIPHLWLLEDRDKDGKADYRKSLQDGFGLRLGYSGHDMHGLAWGPDGKLYWSIGDRGFSVKTKEGKLFHGPNEGAVFRCDPDGSNVELFYGRLRNPQELAFDEWGNLFTADNDGDRSDLERINYIVEGGDSGWHAGHQSLMSFTHKFSFRTQKYTHEYPMNAWEVELMWKEPAKEQPAFMLPGIGQINGGPSGFTYNPSSSMGKDYDDSFFVIHYKGSPQRSRISNFKIIPKGAGFKTDKLFTFFSGSNCVDIEFGPDGKLYMSEFNYGGWLKQDQGNLYTLYFPNEIQKPEVVLHKKILKTDFTKLSITELSQHLERNHKEIRQRAQFELCKRSKEGEKALFKMANDASKPNLSRAHGIWGLGMMAHKNQALLDHILKLINDQDPQIRIQCARVLGDHRYKAATEQLIKTLKDSSPQAAMYAAIGLGRIGKTEAIPALIAYLKTNNNQDRFARHGAVMGLFGIPKIEDYIGFAKDSSSAVRMGVLLSLRKHRDSRLSIFLEDDDKNIVYEAIRAINDLAIEGAQDELAAILPNLPAGKNQVDQFIHHRVINANFYGGKIAHAERLLKYAANTNIPQRQRREALAAIEGWKDDFFCDTTTGLPRKINKDRDDIQATVSKHLAAILSHSQGKLLAQSLRLSNKVSYSIPNTILIKFAKDQSTQVKIRTEAIDKLYKQKSEQLTGLCTDLLSDSKRLVREKALAILVQLKPKLGVEAMIEFSKRKDFRDQQIAISLLAKSNLPEAIKRLKELLERYSQNKLQTAVQLDLLQAAKNSNNSEIQKAYLIIKEALSKKPLMDKFAYCLEGGNAAKGRVIFYQHGTAQCIRCHKVKNTGSHVGPHLTNIGKQHNKKYLLQSLIEPSAAIATGYGSINLTLKNGKDISGTLIEKNEKQFKIKLSDEKTTTINVSDIKTQSPLVSGMPPMHFILKPEEIRDLVEFLSQLKK